MKYTICGFSQAKLVAMGLDLADANILRWFIDFYSTDRMVRVIKPGTSDEYAWVKYGKVMEDMPILGLKNVRSIARRFDAFCSKGIMYRMVVKNQKGTFTCFRANGEVIRDLQTKTIAPPKPKPVVKATPEELERLQRVYLVPNVKPDYSGQALLFAPDTEVVCESGTGLENAVQEPAPDADVVCAPDTEVQCEMPHRTEMSGAEPLRNADNGGKMALLAKSLGTIQAMQNAITQALGEAYEVFSALQEERPAQDTGVQCETGSVPESAMQKPAPDKNVLCEIPQATEMSGAHTTSASTQKTPLPICKKINTAVAPESSGKTSTQIQAAAENISRNKNEGGLAEDKAVTSAPDTDVVCENGTMTESAVPQSAPDSKVQCETNDVKRMCREVDKALVFDEQFYAKAAAFMGEHKLGKDYVEHIYRHVKQKRGIENLRGYFWKVFTAQDILDEYLAVRPAASRTPDKIILCPACGGEMHPERESFCDNCGLALDKHGDKDKVERHKRIAALTPVTRKSYESEAIAIIKKSFRQKEKTATQSLLDEIDKKYGIIGGREDEGE